MLVLILMGQWAAMVLLVAAKSIARFEELKERRFAEYYLVGTLASLLVAILVGLVLTVVLQPHAVSAGGRVPAFAVSTLVSIDGRKGLPGHRRPVGGLSGLYISQFAFGGPAARLGFAMLAVCWLYTGLRAFLAIRRRGVSEHRRWMVRNYSLSFAAVTLRVYIPLSVIAGIEFSTAYAVIAWLHWVPNLIVAEWRFNHVPSMLPRGTAPVG